MHHFPTCPHFSIFLCRSALELRRYAVPPFQYPTLLLTSSTTSSAAAPTRCMLSLSDSSVVTCHDVLQMPARTVPGIRMQAGRVAPTSVSDQIEDVKHRVALLKVPPGEGFVIAWKGSAKGLSGPQHRGAIPEPWCGTDRTILKHMHDKVFTAAHPHCSPIPVRRLRTTSAPIPLSAPSCRMASRCRIQ